MQRVVRRGIMLAAIATGAVVLAAMPASAVDSCKVKVDKKTGVIKVSASTIDPGTLRWGNASGAEVNSFFDINCVDLGTLKGKDCTLADPATLAAKTPPPSCTLYMSDINGPCETWIRGCIPGVRTGRAIVGYVWADQQSSPSYTPSAAYQFNSTGAANTITRGSVGSYIVTFPGIATTAVVPYNQVQVSAYGSNATCTIGQWYAYNPPDLDVYINCTNTSGAPVDSRYSVMVIE